MEKNYLHGDLEEVKVKVNKKINPYNLRFKLICQLMENNLF